MKNRHLLVLVLILAVFSTRAFAQQININASTACSGSISHFTVPPFTLPASTNIEYYTFYAGGDTVTTTENEYNGVFAPGIYTASAQMVLSNGSIVNTPVISFSIVAPPIANFSLNGKIFCINSDSGVCVTNTSVQTTFPIKHYLLDWGTAMFDSINSNFVNTCYKYPFPGSFFITLRAIDSVGCKSDTFFPVTVKDQIIPMIDWSGDIRCSGSLFKFTNRFPGGNTTPNSLQSYSWDFGDGQTYSATAPFTSDQLHHLDSISHYYTADGVFTPSISITDTNGCSVVHSQNYVEQLPLPANIVTNKNIHSSMTAPWQPLTPNEQVFCLNGNSAPVYFTPPTNSVFNFQQNWPVDMVWSYGDPASMQQNFSAAYQGAHLFVEPGQHIVKLDLSNSFPNCVFYDTIQIVGPFAKIESPQQMVIIPQSQRNQLTASDTVDFVNTTVNDGVTTKINFTWNFDDEYAPVCSSYTVPKTGAPLPFNTAKEQYDNSDHYYIKNGITLSGKMNCRYSLDSLPRHKYTNWDSVYSWYINGKNFPPSWGLNPIAPNTSISISAAANVFDPFLLAQGKSIALGNGTLASTTGNYSYITPDGQLIVHNGMDPVPNSTQTFHQFVFDHFIKHPYNVTLSANDSLGKNCSSTSSIALKFGRPNGLALNLTGKQCSGGSPNGVVFDFSKLNNTVVLINFDSLADRKDNTPCIIDGFIGYQGGVTQGGMFFPPFFSIPNFPPSAWTDGTGSKLVYQYGPNAPSQRPSPADSVNGYVTIGMIIGSGCANPPFCTEAEVYTDTIWYHNALQIKNLNAGFTIQNNGKLFSKGSQVTVVPNEPYQPAIAYDMWSWGDGTATVDSFRYAADLNLPGNLTNGYFVNGQRRVRYQFTFGPNNTNPILTDSLPFPNGLPGVKYKTDTLPNNLCPGNSGITTMHKDSAMFLLPITHTLSQTSFEMSEDKTSPTIGVVLHFASNTKGCMQVSSKNITVGVIDSIEITGESPNRKSVFCNGESVSVKGHARYFRCDNSITDILFNPNRSCATNTYYGSPFDAVNFDTMDFWNLNKNKTATIKYTYLNTATNKTDTVYYEKMFWNFGDGSAVITGLTAKHQYTTSGTFTLQMITRDSMGGWDTCSKQIFVSAPVAKINLPSETFPPYAVKTVFNCTDSIKLSDSAFVANNINNSDSIATNYWWFGDAHDTIDWQLRNAKEPTHHYASNGTFRIKLVTETTAGCTDTDYANIFIRGPRPYFSVISNNIGCIPFTVKVVNNADAKRKFVSTNGTTFPNDTPTASTYFDFGDQSPQEVALRHDTLVHTYTTPGQFFIRAYGSDAPMGGQNSCPLVTFPGGNMDTIIFITVNDIATNGVVGKAKVALSEVQPYSVARTTFATYSWSAEGGLITGGQATQTATVDWGTVSGNYRLICTKNTSTCTTSDTLMVTVGNASALDETKHNHRDIAVFPNPASHHFTVKWNKPSNESFKLELYDIVGKTYLSENIPASPADEFSFDIHSLKPGIYFIGIQTANERYTYKLLIQ